jgi:hypothetical protein
MPLIRTETQENFRTELDILRSSGVIKTTEGIEGHFLELMQGCGLDAASILSRVAIIMDSGETDSAKLAAAKLALSLYMHPALVAPKTAARVEQPTIQFVFQTAPGQTSPQINLSQILIPALQNTSDTENLWKHEELNK